MMRAKGWASLGSLTQDFRASGGDESWSIWGGSPGPGSRIMVHGSMAFRGSPRVKDPGKQKINFLLCFATHTLFEYSDIE